MIGKSLFRLGAVAGIFVGLHAGTGAVTQNVDIVVTHGAVIITSTWQNAGLNTVPAGAIQIRGQAFRRGDLPPNTYVIVRDAVSHTPLLSQLNEIDTRRENGDDNSVRHVSVALQLPPSSPQYVSGGIPPGGTYAVEYVLQNGTYTQSGKQTLAGLCASHDLKLHLTDVRNQDDTTRDSGTADFDICAASSNTGRDAPRHLWAGNVVDLWEVRGSPVYAASGNKDPLLYVVCQLYLTTSPSDQTSLGDISPVCRVDNSWMTVAAGSAGYPGAPGPKGFTNDPQLVSYRPELLDGATSVLNWNGLDATVASASNPVQGATCGSDYQVTIPNCLNVPSSAGANAWYYGMATRVTSTGTPVGGLSNGGLYYVYNAGSSNANGAKQNLVSFKPAPVLTHSAPTNGEVLGPSQGTGSTTFSYRVSHSKFMSWFTLPSTGAEMWVVAGSPTTYDMVPAFTNPEQSYWEETGLVIPIDVTQTDVGFGVPWSTGCDPNYHPLGRDMTIGTTSPGPRPDIGIINEYSAAAFITENAADWVKQRVFTLGTTHYPSGSLLNEITGRIPAVNNGPPVGPVGNGIGNSYSELGAPRNGVNTVGFDNLAPPLEDVPVNGETYGGGWGGEGAGFWVSHQPSFIGLAYIVSGRRHYLDLAWFQVNRDITQDNPGPGDGNQSNVIGGNQWWGLWINCCQQRGEAWTMREAINVAILGGDANQERQYGNDLLTENYNYYNQGWMPYKDGSSTNFATALKNPANTGNADDTFFGSYFTTTWYLGQANLHDPLSTLWLSKFAPVYEGNLGEQAPGHLSSYYAIDYTSDLAIHNGDQSLCGANTGQWLNGVDSSDFGGFAPYTGFAAGSGQLFQSNGQSPVTTYTLTSGDQVKSIGVAFFCDSKSKIDQLDGSRWYTVANPDNAAGTFQILCPSWYPTPGDAYCPEVGQPFTSFTRGGQPFTDSLAAMAYRPQYAPATGVADVNYFGYAGEAITAMHILGYSVDHAIVNFNARGGQGWYNSGGAPSQKWNPNMLVP